MSADSLPRLQSALRYIYQEYASALATVTTTIRKFDCCINTKGGVFLISKDTLSYYFPEILIKKMAVNERLYISDISLNTVTLSWYMNLPIYFKTVNGKAEESETLKL